ncbi:rab-GTPase-TBC domain-domain-containing protein [Catenaria anguillulae PL171]|uniref:Rab-GTPase-TBC domain-domain-containing protein n=1 Tax=Catenaria anguillulae PL171 TaxID=765915 RepID=A0A1Y2HUQ9_9FUNG|nr:rab-GTPase-TBC domain-domain-containing protein [Catenaria anguillulae PL171]
MAAPPVDFSDYDQYGFRIESQFVSRSQWQRAEQESAKSAAKHAVKWKEMILSNGGYLPDRSEKVKKMIRKGVPPPLRRNVWFEYSGAKVRMKANPGVYAAMLAREQQSLDAGIRPANEHIDIIERDLHRTFPDNLHFKRTPIPNCPPPPYTDPSAPPSPADPLVNHLRRVLVAFSFFNTEIGYCQSLNYIVGLLLLFMPEEEAFWMLVVMCEDLLPHGMYSKSLSGTITEMKVFKDIVREKCKTLVEKVQAGGIVDLDMLVSPWFLTIYVNILPVEAALRTWDCFFFEGNKILYRIALAILKLAEDDVSKLKDPMEVVQYIQNAPKRMVDAEKLMKTAFQRFGSKAVGKLSHHDIDNKRDKEISRQSMERARSESGRSNGAGGGGSSNGGLQASSAGGGNGFLSAGRRSDGGASSLNASASNSRAGSASYVSGASTPTGSASISSYR